MFWPVSTVSGEDTIVTPRSAEGLTLVVVVAVLLVVTVAGLLVVCGSGPALVTVAVSVIPGSAAVRGTMSMITLAVLPTGIEPRAAVTVPPACVGAVPRSEVAETNLTPAGSGLVRT